MTANWQGIYFMHLSRWLPSKGMSLKTRSLCQQALSLIMPLFCYLSSLLFKKNIYFLEYYIYPPFNPIELPSLSLNPSHHCSKCFYYYDILPTLRIQSDVLIFTVLSTSSLSISKLLYYSKDSIAICIYKRDRDHKGHIDLTTCLLWHPLCPANQPNQGVGHVANLTNPPHCRPAPDRTLPSWSRAGPAG